MFTDKEIEQLALKYSGDHYPDGYYEFIAGFKKSIELIANMSEASKMASKSVRNMGICIAGVGASDASNEVKKLIDMIEDNVIEVQKLNIDDLIVTIPELKTKSKYQPWEHKYKFHG